MSKRFRFLVVLALIGVSVYFIYPTVSWYFFIPQESKELAASTREQVRDHAREEARAVLDELAVLAADDEDSVLPREYRFLIDHARDNYRLDDRDLPDEWTVSSVLSAFRTQDEAFDVIEEYYAEELFALKDLKDRIITLGLDLAGGMSAVVEADRDSLAERLDRQPTSAEVNEAIELSLTILRSRIDQFGVTEPQIRRQEGSDRILIEVPGDNDRTRIEAFLQGKGNPE